MPSEQFDMHSARAELLQIRQGCENYSEFNVAVVRYAAHLCAAHKHLLNTDTEYKSIVRGTNIHSSDIDASATNGTNGTNSISINHTIDRAESQQNITLNHSTINSTAVHVHNNSKRDRTLKSRGKSDIACAHSCGACEFKIRLDNTQVLCRQHMLRFDKKHSQCNNNCDVYNYINYNVNGTRGIPLWHEIASYVYQHDIDTLKQTVDRREAQTLTTSQVLAQIAQYCVDQYATNNDTTLFTANIYYTDALIELVRHTDAELANTIKATCKLQRSITPILTQHNSVAPVVPLVTATVTPTATAVDADTDDASVTEIESHISSQIQTRSRSNASVNTDTTDSTISSTKSVENNIMQLSIDHAQKRKPRNTKPKSTNKQPPLLDGQAILTSNCINDPTMSTYQSAWKQYISTYTEHTTISVHTKLSQALNQSDNVHIQQLRYDLINGLMSG